MNNNTIVSILILIILVGVGMFAFEINPTVSYASIGVVIVAFIALLFATRKKSKK
jgi:membrane protein YdbS with pleckstrin-like domain